ncbi:fimbrial protein [Klebsiella pneumoniae]|uniref:fimbrial protein n=1 Tax=Klebsiella pneumoniae TaxID=573 RepID=UPI0034CDAC83
MYKISRTIFRSFFVLFYMLFNHAEATISPSNIDVSISGTIVATAACKFSGQNPISIEFGDVYINNISNESYKKEISYKLTCNGDSGGKKTQMQFSGTTNFLDSSALNTDVKGLRIKLYANNTSISVNKWFDFDIANMPKLYAVLIKDKNASLKNGQEFNATATLKVSYN